MSLEKTLAVGLQNDSRGYEIFSYIFVIVLLGTLMDVKSQPPAERLKTSAEFKEAAYRSKIVMGISFVIELKDS